MNSIQISLTAKNYADALVQVGRDNVLSYDDILKNTTPEKQKLIYKIAKIINED